MAGPAGGGRRGNRAVPMATLRPGARGWGRRSISRPRPVLGGLRGPRLRAWGGLDRREGSGISSPRCGWGRGGGSRLGVRPGRGFHPGGVWTRPRRRVAKVRPTERSTSQIGKNQAKYDHDARIKTATNREGLPQRSLPPAAGSQLPLSLLHRQDQLQHSHLLQAAFQEGTSSQPSQDAARRPPAPPQSLGHQEP
nr:uncharacterized protein LOC129465528 isoform X3 [Symphalangus syndactylus]